VHLALWEVGILTGEAQVEYNALNEVREDAVNTKLHGQHKIKIVMVHPAHGTSCRLLHTGAG
jgi:hypothetical protein